MKFMPLLASPLDALLGHGLLIIFESYVLNRL